MTLLTADDVGAPGQTEAIVITMRRRAVPNISKSVPYSPRLLSLVCHFGLASIQCRPEIAKDLAEDAIA